jgi:hypothetical protein
MFLDRWSWPPQAPIGLPNSRTTTACSPLRRARTEFATLTSATLARPVLPIALNRTRSHQIAPNRTDFETPLTHSPTTTNEPTPQISRSPATPRSASKRTTQHSSTPPLRPALSAPRRPTQTQSFTNSDQFRAIPTKRHLREFFLPRPDHLDELSYCSAALAKSTSQRGLPVQHAEVERLTEGRDADRDLAVLQFANSRAGQPNHMILKS